MDATMIFISLLVVAAIFLWLGYRLGRIRYRRNSEDWQAKGAFPVGWKVGYVGLSPDGSIVEWCGDDEAVAWITRASLNEREAYKESKGRC